MDNNDGRLPDGTGLSSATPIEPASPSRSKASIPSADELIDIGGREVLRFHPTHKRIKDDTPRCISCGQIDEDGFHDERWCPGMGGYLPFGTSSVAIKLKADSGFRSEASARLSIQQWRLINIALNAGVDLPPEVVNATAQAIEVRRAETGTGSVHESAVAKPCAQGDGQ